ncbi:MAG: iron-sulfur cluster assembly accessory protein [Alphaproteobacteria bacterium]|nr:iron-sulfur cluster assembly accessory protein [Alphaproteobacteria bacterium]OJV15815.1 MAG: Fe-S cluster assembly scaffold SufA [Alphaproteobacteria bacterium 33-17]
MEKTARPRRAVINISENAIKRIKELLSKRDKESAGVRVGVRSGGCSGLSYTVEYADSVTEFDIVVEQDDVKVLIDRKAELYLLGTTMDFVEEKFKSGFVFVNPNEKGRCGCGESFHI